MPSNVPTKKILRICNPALAREWHPAKNGNLTPTHVTISFHEKVWWQCLKGHEWEATVSERSEGNACPYCSNKKVNDDDISQTVNPPPARVSLSAKNESPTQGEVTANSDKNVKDENSLQAVNPTLAKEWHPAKNGSLRPENVTANSHNQVWWQCSKGHEWKAAISSRSNGQGCFYCSYMQKRKR
jgi:hypothetical protein